jgi:hypothetical protein
MYSKLIQMATTIVIALPAWTDSLTLTNGKIYRGTFLGASSDQVILQVDGHDKRRFSLSEIDSIHFTRLEPADTLPIDQKYNALSQIVGSPAGEEQAAGDGRGRYRLYQNGAIYYTPQTGAHAVRGAIGERWLNLGAEHSELGYPTSDEICTPDGLLMRFEHGAIVWDQRDVPVVEISAR